MMGEMDLNYWYVNNKKIICNVDGNVDGVTGYDLTLFLQLQLHLQCNISYLLLSTTIIRANEHL